MFQFEEDFSPPESMEAKIYFQVVVDYNKELIKSMIPKSHADKVEEMGPVESIALGSYDEADQLAHKIVGIIHDKFPGSDVKELEPEEQKDEYNVWVKHPNGAPIAKVGVIGISYSEETIH